MYEVDKGKKIMEHILIALTRKHKFVWHEIHKAIETYEPVCPILVIVNGKQKTLRPKLPPVKIYYAWPYY